ncbi:tripartite tricarboxylate transporter substrate binding protein [Alcaligenaceae bacterium A4P071]|nr:tripartite tricarboxylate transporter substrate binding protein [Alcaligenaceae bacterium A4P071]
MHALSRTLAVVMITAATASVGAPTPAYAQRFPDHAVRLIVGYAAGGGTDLIARIAAQHLAEELNVPVIVENRPGAGGNIATEAVARATPDGYTLLLAANTVTINPSLYKNQPFDLERDIRGVGVIANSPIVLLTSPASPYASFNDMIAYAKGHPNAISYGTPGVGTPQHLAVELMTHMTGVKMTHVPYKGSSQSLSDGVAGHIGLVSAAINSGQPFMVSNKLRALAVADSKRVASFPDMPAVGEIVPGYEVRIWYGIMAPRRTPDAIVTQLNAALGRAVAKPGMATQMKDQGYEVAFDSPANMDRQVHADIEKWGAVVKEAGIQPE